MVAPAQPVFISLLHLIPELVSVIELNICVCPDLTGIIVLLTLILQTV